MKTEIYARQVRNDVVKSVQVIIEGNLHPQTDRLSKVNITPGLCRCLTTLVSVVSASHTFYKREEQGRPKQEK